MFFQKLRRIFFRKLDYFNINSDLIKNYSNLRYKMGWKKYTQFGFKLYQQKLKHPKKLIGLDIGKQMTGMSLSCSKISKLLQTLKYPINNLEYPEKLFKAITKHDNITGVVIGLPFHATSSQGSENEINGIIQGIGKRMENFETNPELLEKESQFIDVKRILAYLNLPYCFVDQNWTTFEAKRKIYEIMEIVKYHGHAHDQKQIEDGIAAMKILERFTKYYNTN